jgi:hypothetical protein
MLRRPELGDEPDEVRLPLATGVGEPKGPCGVPPVSWYTHSVATWSEGRKVAT